MRTAVAVLVLVLATPAAASSMRAASGDVPVVHHDVKARLDLDTGRLTVTDRVTLPDGFPRGADGALTTSLHGGLAPTSSDADVVVRSSSEAESSSMKGESRGTIPVDVVVITPKAGASTFTLSYGGVIVHAPEPSPLEHARSFSETAGTIGKDGAYLAGSTQWLARFGDELLTFTLEVDGLPKGFSVVSEGDEVKATQPFTFRSDKPVDDVHLIAGPFVRTEKVVDGVKVQAMLRAPDPALAERYLEVTGQYLKMYNALLGPYPWSRFALVENFWETGYGMPGFTLLGPKIIRFPFILHTSYPHELLHNWWGNSVYLPHQGDNWCEGLTAYLADHLVDEQRGKGPEYRQRVLAKYQDFVRPENDFPVRTFSGRFSPASEAIGYGKWAMTLHMLRGLLGDEKFAAFLKDFYATQRFKRTTFKDVQRAAERQHGASLDGFFTAWLDRTGMPSLRWSDVRAYRAPSGKWSVTLALSQTQREAPFPLRVPFIVTTDDGRATEGVVTMDGASRDATVELALAARPVRVDIDPRFDVFRRLDRDEIAPSLSLTLGAKKVLFVVPKDALPEELDAWRAFAAAICPPAEAGCRTVTDQEVGTLPDDGAVWILGYGNALRAAAMVGVKRFGARFDDATFTVGTTRQSNGDRSVALAIRNPRNADYGMVFVGADNLAAIAGLARKLPHYGKYGYLGFSGDEPTNVLKGQWPAEGSPMTVLLDGRGAPMGRTRPAAALASLPPPFDADRMVAMVKALAAPEMEGRGYGSPGLEKATVVVERAFAEAGLRPLGKSGFRDCAPDPQGPDGKAVIACNVLGVLPGEDPSLPVVVLAAHLDHLGKGWPEARKGEAGKVHPGANDNASGVAVLVDVARAIAAQGPQKRTVVFAAFTGEEAGLRGARRYLAALGPVPSLQVMAMVNLDTVGRKDGGKKLLVMGSETAREWVHVFMGIGFVTGVESEMSAQGLMASDHQAFVEKGIPAVQIFGGPSLDYHRSSDTADKIEPATLVDVAVLTREAVLYLAGRDTPLSSTMGGAPAAAPAAKDERKVALGTVPDFAFGGPGVKLSGVTPGSPAERAGLQKGDVLVEMGGDTVRDLRHFADILRTKKAGDVVRVVVVRDGAKITKDITLEAR